MSDALITGLATAKRLFHNDATNNTEGRKETVEDEIIFRDETMDDVEGEQVIRLVQKVYYEKSGYDKEAAEKGGRQLITDERIRDIHRIHTGKPDIVKQICGERNGKMVCRCVGILMNDWFDLSKKRVEIFLICVDRDEDTKGAPQAMFDLLIGWAKEKKADFMQMSFDTQWKGSAHLVNFMESRYGFKPKEITYYKSLKE